MQLAIFAVLAVAFRAIWKRTATRRERRAQIEAQARYFDYSRGVPNE